MFDYARKNYQNKLIAHLEEQAKEQEKILQHAENPETFDAASIAIDALRAEIKAIPTWTDELLEMIIEAISFEN